MILTMRDYENLTLDLRERASSYEQMFGVGESSIVMKDAADAIKELVAAVPKWISVEERLPECGERVLVSNGGFVCESFLSQSGEWQRGGVDMFFMTPTHWMPLPAPPKEVE